MRVEFKNGRDFKGSGIFLNSKVVVGPTAFSGDWIFGLFYKGSP